MKSIAEQQVAYSRNAAMRANNSLRAFTVLNDQVFRSDPSLPLNGLPIGVKDLYDTQGMVTTYGSPIYQSHMPAKDAALVERLQSLGAFVIGKTVTTEFAWRHAGPTVNPWDGRHTPGGSSSGSAAAVAAGIVPLALGTQTFGSIIRPAAFCGVFGFKPTFGSLPTQGIHPLSPSLDHAGYLANSARLVRDVHGLLTGRSASSRSEGRTHKLRLVRGRFWRDATATQRATLEDAASTFRAAGAEITERELPAQFDDGLACAETILRREASAIYRPLADEHPGQLSSEILDLVRLGEGLSAADLDNALAARDRLRSLFARELDGFDAILTVPALGEAPLSSEGTGNAGPCVLWTLLGAPAAAVPTGFGHGGLPLGVQLVGAHAGDAELLDVCTFAERIFSVSARKSYRI